MNSRKGICPWSSFAWTPDDSKIHSMDHAMETLHGTFNATIEGTFDEACCCTCLVRRYSIACEASSCGSFVPLQILAVLLTPKRRGPSLNGPADGTLTELSMACSIIQWWNIQKAKRRFMIQKNAQQNSPCTIRWVIWWKFNKKGQHAPCLLLGRENLGFQCWNSP